MADDLKQALDQSDASLKRLESGLQIDREGLDDAVLHHAEYLYNVGKRHTEAISYRDEAKNDFDGTKAKLNLQIRMKLVEDGEKATESAVEARIVVHPEYQNAQYVLGAWNDRVNNWRVLWESACARTDMLKECDRLWVGGYWATESIGAQRNEARDRTAERVKDALAEKRRTRPRLSDAVE